MLHAFTPYNFTDLLEVSKTNLASNQALELTLEDCMFLIPFASMQPATKYFDTAQATRMVEAVNGPQPAWTLDKLLKIGASITPSARRLRNEMAFTASTKIGSSRHIYTPSSMLPELMASLIEGLNDSHQIADSCIMTALVNFYCANLHPFSDGNGRWSRLVSLSVGASKSSISGAIINSIFQIVKIQELTQVSWPCCRETGLRQYYEDALKYEESILSSEQFNRATRGSKATAIAIEKAVSSKSFRLNLLLNLSLGQKVPLSTLRKRCGLSQRAFNALINRIESDSLGLVRPDMDDLSADALVNEYRECFSL